MCNDSQLSIAATRYALNPRARSELDRGLIPHMRGCGNLGSWIYSLAFNQQENSMNRRLFSKYKLSLAAALTLSLAACGGGGSGGNDEGSTSPSATGSSQNVSQGSNTGGSQSIEGTVWVRLPGPSGDRTEIAIGGIKNEPANRVYMCEKKGSTAAGFYKGIISENNVVKWDAEHGLPDAYFTFANGKLVFEYRINGSLPTNYDKGSWSGECGPLENLPPTKLAVVLPSGLSGITGVSIDGKSVSLISLAAGAPRPDCSNPGTTFTLPRPSKSNSNGAYYTVLVSDRTQSVDAGGAYRTTTYETTFYSYYFTAGACNTYKVEWGNMGYTLVPL